MLTVNQLTIKTLKDRILIDHLSFTCVAGDKIAVIGEEGKDVYKRQEGRDENMKLSRKLPEAEFEIMKVFWEKESQADLKLFDIKMKRKTDG